MKSNIKDKGKILFIYPPSPVLNREDRCQQPTKELLVIPPLPPTDLMYLASISEQCGLEAKIKDYSLGGNLIEDLNSFQPDYLLANIATPTFKSDMEALALAKSILPNLIIIVKGAPFLLYNTNVVYEYPFIDYVILGEPELTLKEISAVLEVSESRISQLHTKAIQKLRLKLGANIELFF